MKSVKKIIVLILLPLVIMVAYADSVGADDEAISVYATTQQMKNEAAKFKPVKWKLPLGQHVIEQMTIVTENIALLELKNYTENFKKDQIRAVNLTTGKQKWLYSADDDAIKINLVGITTTLVLIENIFNNSIKLVAVSKNTGKQLWEKTIPKPGLYKIQQFDNVISIAIYNNKAVTYTLYDFKTGHKQWFYKINTKQKIIPNLIFFRKNIVIPGVSLIALNLNSGKLQWNQTKLGFNNSNIVYRVIKNNLYILDKKNVVYKINSAKGSIVWKHKFKKKNVISAIDIKKSVIYFRGFKKISKKAVPIIISLDKSRGKKLWQTTINTKLPLISNLIETKGKLFVATPTSLFALNQKSGKLIYSRVASNSQKSLYPVTLRKIDNSIVFIGEMNFKAYLAATGSLIYRKSITAINQETDLTALDASIKRLIKKKKHGDNYEVLSNLKFEYTQLNNKLESSYHTYGQKINGEWGTGYKNSFDANQAQSVSLLARMEVAESLTLLVLAMVENSVDEETLERHKLIQTSIHLAYPQMLTQNYIFRPTRNLSIMDDSPEFLQITAINLKSGKKKKTSMSVPFKDYGLWIHVDEKKKIAYQQSIGLDYNDETPPISYLIAKPLQLPK